MAPNSAEESSVERTQEREDFLNTLAEYHEKRGWVFFTVVLQWAHIDSTCRTVLDREPKVGSRQIDLLRLYKRVNEEGGYDRVSDTKGNKLAWRKIASEFLPKSPSITTQAFLVKSAYYKNLAYVTRCELQERSQ
jgi:chromatin structure-remodeling complex subunit RSC9